MQNRLLHLKGTLPKYLLAITLLLSSLAFSGYTGKSKYSPERLEQAALSQQKSQPAQKIVRSDAYYSWETRSFYPHCAWEEMRTNHSERGYFMAR